MSGLILLSETGIQALGWMLLHFVWQGFAVAAVLAVTRVLVRDSRLRYAIACVALLAMVMLPVSTLLTQELQPFSSHGQVARHLVGLPATEEVPSVLTPSQPGVSGSGTIAATEGPDRWAGLASSLQNHLPEIVAFWLTGVLLLSLRLLGGCWVSFRLRRKGTSPLPVEWQARVDDLVKTMHIRQRVRVVTSSLSTVPLVVGIFRPVVLLPISTLLGLTHDQLETILIHELAHVRRFDNLVNLSQRLAETVFFFHPAVWWVSNQIRAEREHCCDDVATMDHDPKLYAGALAALEGHRSPALASTATGGPLLSRIRRLLAADREGGRRRPWSSPVSSFLGVLVVLTFMAFTLGATLSANQEEEKEMASESSKKLSRKVLDIERTKVWTRIITALHDMLQAAGETEWSVPRLQGVMGNGFSFEMRKGGGQVWQEGNLDWWLVFEKRREEDLGCRIQRFQPRGNTNEAEGRKIMKDAWDAVRASIDRGVPVAAWAPMYENDEPNAARDWGLIVGYDEASETYVIGRRVTEFEYRYDEIGGPDTDNPQFCVLVYEGPGAGDDTDIHLKALRNAVAFANGTRYDTDAAPIKVDARGMAAFDLWLDAMKSGSKPDPDQRSPRSEGIVTDTRDHAGFLSWNRGYVRDYLRELVDIFPTAASDLESAAGHYHLVSKAASELYAFCERAEEADDFSAEARANAARLIATALEEERKAIAGIQRVLATVDVEGPATPSSNANSRSGEVNEAHSSKILEGVHVARREDRAGHPWFIGGAFSTIVDAYVATLRAAGDEWSVPRVAATFGFPFHFCLKNGAVRHDHNCNIETWLFFHRADELGWNTVEFQKWSGGADQPPDTLAVMQEQAWEATTKSIDRGVPAIAWSPYTNQDVANWGMLVGYDDGAKTYSVSHVATDEIYTVPFDGFGNRWFVVSVLTDRKDFDPKAHEIKTLRRAVEFSNGTLYTVKESQNCCPVDAIGFDAYELWLDALSTGDFDADAAGDHAWQLEHTRGLAAEYTREISGQFGGDAEQSLLRASATYQEEREVCGELLKIVLRWAEKTPPAEEVKEAERLLAAALVKEKEAVGYLEEALRILDQ